MSYPEPTYRQLDHWVRRGWLSPVGGNGTGHRREWPARERRVALVMKRLTEAGFQVETAADVARIVVELGVAEVHLGYGVTVRVDEPR